MGQILTYAERKKWLALPLKERRAISNARGEETRDRSARSGTDKQRREANRLQRLEDVAILDFETTPFDNTRPDTLIEPFCAVLYSTQFDPVVIWDNDRVSFCKRVVSAIENLPRKWTIYAHNGGRFDYMFLLSYLRGKVTFKGRGLMHAQLGNHELRDSYHILPMRLAAYQKDAFDYANMLPENRELYRAEIVEYCTNDCKYLYRLVRAFLDRFGFALTIGQAAMAELKKVYEFDRLNERLDANFRRFYHGGRVECLQGSGCFLGAYKIYDLNSAYPDAMRNKKHPHKADQISWRYGELPTEKTSFIHLRCHNKGALVSSPLDGKAYAKKMFDIAQQVHPTGEVTYGEFFTTIWEHDIALKHGLIWGVEYIECVDFEERTDFSKFIDPLYAEREVSKEILDTLGKEKSHLEEYIEAFQDSTFSKFIQNNAYGKFAQNPEKFRDRWIADADGGLPEDYGDGDGWECEEFLDPETEEPAFVIWSRPAPEKRYNNVAIAASITGAVRAKLLDALATAIDPIYCDTDSITCLALPHVEFSATKLGAWDLETEATEVLIVGKKTYACRNGLEDKKPKLRAKGVSNLQWDDYVAILNGARIESRAKAVTIYKSGTQDYLLRRVRTTAPKRKEVAK
jgi:hypothetical protein